MNNQAKAFLPIVEKLLTARYLQTAKDALVIIEAHFKYYSTINDSVVNNTWAPLKILVFDVKWHHLPDEDNPMPQPGFFDLDERYAKLNERDPLVKLNPIIDWEAFREPLSVLRPACSRQEPTPQKPGRS